MRIPAHLMIDTIVIPIYHRLLQSVLKRPDPLILFFIGILFLFSVGATKSFAQIPPKGESPQRMPDESVVYPDYEPRPAVTPYLGEDHAYTVTFRGNGEAVVVGRFIFTNTSDTRQQYYRLRVPKVNPDEIIVFAQLRHVGCLRYDSYYPPVISPQPIPLSQGYEPCFAYTTESQCITSSSLRCGWFPADESCRTLATPTPALYRKPTCIQYEEPDYYNFWAGTSEYKKVDFEQLGDELEIKLNKPLSVNQSAAVILYFRAFGYAKKSLPGRYSFAFETLETSHPIKNLTVAIETDSDLYLKGAKGKTNYNVEQGVAMLKSAPTSLGAVGGGFDNYYQQIGLGMITKTTGNLAAGESYTVSGLYADSVYKLYLKEISLGILAAAVFVLFMLVLARLIIRHFEKTQIEPKKPAKAATVPAHKNASNILMTLGTSFASSVLISFSWIAYYFLAKISPFDYYNYDLLLILTILKFALVLLVVFIDLLALLVPAVYVWKKKSAFWGIATLAATILWLIFFLVLIFVFLLFFYQNRTYPSDLVPLYGGASRMSPMK